MGMVHRSAAAREPHLVRGVARCVEHVVPRVALRRGEIGRGAERNKRPPPRGVPTALEPHPAVARVDAVERDPKRNDAAVAAAVQL